jgi:hypothetical protein
VSGLDARLRRIEAKQPAERMTVRPCAAPAGLSAEAHAAYHVERGEYCFTLDLGAASIHYDPDDAEGQ